MDYLMMTDSNITEELGRRLCRMRLRKNLTQDQVATITGLSRTAVQGAEKGASTLLTYVKILRALNSLDSLDDFLPDIGISPLELAKAQGKERQRASQKRK